MLEIYARLLEQAPEAGFLTVHGSLGAGDEFVEFRCDADSLKSCIVEMFYAPE